MMREGSISPLGCHATRSPPDDVGTLSSPSTSTRRKNAQTRTRRIAIAERYGHDCARALGTRHPSALIGTPRTGGQARNGRPSESDGRWRAIHRLMLCN